MEIPKENPPMVILPIGDGKWSATTQTPDGPLTAIGDSIEDAKVSLDGLLMSARAVEAARRQIEALTHRERLPRRTRRRPIDRDGGPASG